MVDIHNHSYFSFDSKEDPINNIEAAINKGAVVFGFAEHLNLCENQNNKEKILGFRKYCKYMKKIEKQYKSKIILVHGLEFNYFEGQEDNYVLANKKLKIDYAINSVHSINKVSFYLENYLKDKDENVVAKEYMDEVIASLNVKYDYQVLGHLGTISKLFTTRDKNIKYNEFPEKFDLILSYLIKNNKALEVNTNFDGINTFPHETVLRRYYELGGRIITLASDAHISSKVLLYTENALNILRKIGFDSITYYKNKERKDVKI